MSAPRCRILRLYVLALVVFLSSVAAGLGEESLELPATPGLLAPIFPGDDSTAAAHTETETLHSDNQDDIAYQADFVGIQRDIIGETPTHVARADAPRGMANNVPLKLNSMPGFPAYYSFALSDLRTRDQNPQRNGSQDLEARQQSRSVYISINTCLQPTFTAPDQAANPPQLSLYLSTDGNVQNPGPGSPGVQSVTLVEGYANATVQVSSTVYIGVVAPEASVDGSSSTWNYEIAASVDGFYHSSFQDPHTSPSIYFIDSDPTAALLRTDNLFLLAPGANATNSSQNPNPNAEALVNNWLNTLQGHVTLELFATEANYAALNGIRHSYCGLSTAPSMRMPEKTNAYNSIVTRNTSSSSTEQKFYIPELARTTEYTAFLTRSGNSIASGAGVVHGGGAVFGSALFRSKRNANCQVIYNLPFCDQVEYAVPANPAKHTSSELAQLYDASASAVYANFTLVMAQQQCEGAAPNEKYSLATTCDACREKYNTWLCAVTAPRCEDLVDTSSVQYPRGPTDAVDDDAADQEPSGTGYLMPRNLAQSQIPDTAPLPASFLTEKALLDWTATNSTRNPALIGGDIQPGPYHEVLPCEDLCYDIVRHCPAALGFACPQPGSRMMRASYGRIGRAANGASTCSAPGEVYKVRSGARGLHVEPLLVGSVVGFAILWLF